MAKDFLSFLVDETLKLQQSGEAELSSLELKLTDYSLIFLKGEFIPQTQMLRFHTSFGMVDIPVNWSVFAIGPADTSDHILTHENDHDHLLGIMKNVWNKDLEKILITHADGFCYLVGLRSGEESHLHDLMNPQELLNAA